MSEHTEGRIEAFTEESFSGWFALRQITDDGLNHEIGSGDGGLFEPDARRLAAAWNACEGIDTGALERIGDNFIKPMIDLQEQRDAAKVELNAARALLREILDLGEVHYEAADKVRAYFDACDKPGEPT